MESRKLIKAIAVLGTLTAINCCGIIGINYALAQPQNSYSIDTLGAVFHQPTEDNVVEISLIRPPRKTVHPGEITEETGTLTNTKENPLSCRATYQIVIKDKNNQEMNDFANNVLVTIDKDWIFEDGYWYYINEVQPGESINTFIDAIEYTEAFNEHLDYKVYVYALTEVVEIKDGKLAKWPNKDIESLYEEANSKSASWTTKVNIIT